MAHKNTVIVLNKSDKKSKVVFWVFFGIIAFLAIWFPFFGPDLRFKTSATLSKAFTSVGTILVTFGVIMFMWGMLSLFCGRTSAGVKVMVLGAVLIFLGGYFITPSLVGAGSTGKRVPRGYH